MTRTENAMRLFIELRDNNHIKEGDYAGAFCRINSFLSEHYADFDSGKELEVIKQGVDK